MIFETHSLSRTNAQTKRTHSFLWFGDSIYRERQKWREYFSELFPSQPKTSIETNWIKSMGQWRARHATHFSVCEFKWFFILLRNAKQKPLPASFPSAFGHRVSQKSRTLCISNIRNVYFFLQYASCARPIRMSKYQAPKTHNAPIRGIRSFHEMSDCDDDASDSIRYFRKNYFPRHLAGNVYWVMVHNMHYAQPIGRNWVERCVRQMIDEQFFHDSCPVFVT